MILSIKANPGAKKSKIKRYENDILYVDIKAPAQDGKANAELLHFLAKTFKLPTADIKIISGQTGKLKKVKLDVSEEEIAKAVER